MNKIQLPINVENIIKILNNNGYEAFIVGGCVRDSIMKKQPQDWDITTDALPKDIKRLFRATIDTGIKHGTVSVIINHSIYEITTYRIDGEYIDGRHPENVYFTDKLKEDLKRRDFTINAMAYNHDTNIVDYYDGCNDIKRKLIRCVGNPIDRFNEDALRILRAIRFSAKLGFTIEKETFQAMNILSKNLVNISAERIREEFVKTLNSPNPKKLNIIKEIGADQYIFEGGCKFFITDSMSDMILSSEDEHIKLSILFKGNPNIKYLLRNMRFDNKTIYAVDKIINCNMEKFNMDEIGFRRMLNLYDIDLTSKILKYNILLGKLKDYDYNNFLLCLEKRPVYKREQLNINGKDIIKLGYKGKDIGDILDRLIEHVIVFQDDNKLDILINMIRNNVFND